MSIWADIAELESKSDLGTTFVLTAAAGEPEVRVDNDLTIMVEGPHADSHTCGVVNVPDGVVYRDFHDSYIVNAHFWESCLGYLLEELDEVGGRIVFERHPISWDRDEDDDPQLRETEPTIYQGWALLVREQIGEDFCDSDGCSKSLDDGEGWDGKCGDCADRIERARERAANPPLNASDIAGYTFKAETLCQYCTVQAMNKAGLIDTQEGLAEDLIESAAKKADINLGDHHSFDSGDFPKSFEWGSVRYDESCDGCEDFLDAHCFDRPHVGHRLRLTGAWWCDTCDSPLCDLA